MYLQYPTMEIYREVCGLSCIENHVLALLKANRFPIERLYGNSCLSMSRLWQAFLIERVPYAAFQGVERIQDELKRAGAIHLERRQEAQILPVLQITRENQAVLARVTHSYAKTQLRTKGWREDHYVLLSSASGQTTLYNDIPFAHFSIPQSEAETVYDRAYFLLTFHWDVLEKLFAHHNAPSGSPRAEWVPPTALTPEDLPNLRDLIGVYRVLLRRWKKAAMVQDITAAEDWIKQADLLYMQAEYLHIKKTKTAFPIQSLLQQFIQLDRDVQAAIYK